MATTNDNTDLRALGGALSASTERDLRRRRQRPLRRVALAVALVAIIGTGTVAAATLLTPKQVAHAMPAGAVIFDRPIRPVRSAPPARSSTARWDPRPPPRCRTTPGRSSFSSSPARSPVGASARMFSGMHWDCYVGQDAVDTEIVTQDFLGQPAGPGRG